MSEEVKRKTKIVYEGELVEAEEVGFKPVKEDWNEYQLDDGSVLRIKLVVVGAFRVEKYDDVTGAPHYLVRSNNVVTVSVPESLKKR